MDQRKIRAALVACIVLFIAAFILSAVFSQDETETWKNTEGGQVVLSEIMSSNRTYPAPDGQYLDFIEIRNLSGNPTDISGYMLSDSLNSIGYTFPDGTILPGYGYAVCWCNKNGDPESYGTFGISREGGETVYLYNNANVIVDEREMPAMDPNTSLIRDDATTWSVTEQPTPGYANTQEGYNLWLDAMGGSRIHVVISEIVTDNTCITSGAETQPLDYVELTNLGSETAYLDGAYLSNDPQDPLKWQIPHLTLAAGERAVIYCAGGGDGKVYAPFGLSKSGCTVVLTGSLGNTLSRVECPDLQTDHAWSLNSDGTYRVTDYATPGFANDEAGYQAWMEAVGADQMQVVISEIMTSNRSTLLSDAGMLCDWVELTNMGQTTVVLDNAYLTDDLDQRGKWKIPALTLAPGERVVIRCAGANAGEGEADFALAKSGTTVILSGPQGNIISKVDCPRMEDDRTWAMQPDGTYVETDMPSPGFENTEQGYLDYRASQTFAGPLMISEVMVSNDRYLIQSDAKYYDWVELVNVSDQTVDLAEYYLSDDAENLEMFQLPQRSLGPGERIVIICSANDQLVGNYIQASFTLSSEECWVYISSSAGELCDYMRVSNVPAQGSAGRLDGESGTWYFEMPTPGNPNGTGVALISHRPELLTPEGVYNAVADVTVAFQGTGQLHYTLDGSIPTQADPIYEAPLVLTQTTVLRVVNMEAGKLPSEVVTACFIINENHTLPVLSLAVSPDAMFGASGIYTTNTFGSELLCNLKLFEADGMFSVDCGVELMGNMASDPEKKSFKVNFRGRYGADVLGYPIYGAQGPQVFDALSLSAGSDEGQTLFRDEMFSQLSLQMGDSVQARRAKFCVLYINGEYWGVYSLKEALGEMYYSQNAMVAVDNVTELREPAQWGSEIYELAEFCANNDLSVQENYDYVASRVNISSLIDWMILQGYSCNRNIGENLRYYQSPERGSKWDPVLSDLDGAFYYRDGFANVFASDQPWGYTELTCGLINNSVFREQFLQRLSQVAGNTLSNENVLSVINSLETLLQPEMERELGRWGGYTQSWAADVERLRAFITRYDHWALLEDSLRTCIGLTDEEAEQHFGR